MRGFDVETFPTIDTFTERGNPRAASCLVLDINLNGSSGIELKRKLNEAGIAPPVIFITGRDEDATRRAALSAGCVAYLRKPFSSKEFVEAINISLGMSYTIAIVIHARHRANTASSAGRLVTVLERPPRSAVPSRRRGVVRDDRTEAPQGERGIAPEPNGGYQGLQIGTAPPALGALTNCP